MTVKPQKSNACGHRGMQVRRIEELTGRDLSCLDDQVNFFLALRIR